MRYRSFELLSNHCGIETSSKEMKRRRNGSYYRTIVELKQTINGEEGDRNYCYYRTIVELKRGHNYSCRIVESMLLSNHCGIETANTHFSQSIRECYYRTIVELKH